MNSATTLRPPAAIIGALMLLFGIVFTAVAPSAAAHNALISSDPAADSVVPTPPTSIELVFNQEVKDFQPRMAITITGHDPVEIVPMVNGPTVTADLTSVGLPGSESTEPVSWRVGYRVVSADGHPVTGLLDFSVGTGPGTMVGATAEPSTPAVSPAGDQVSADQGAFQAGSWATGWWWIGGAVAAVAVVLAVVLVLRRRPSP